MGDILNGFKGTAVFDSCMGLLFVIFQCYYELLPLYSTLILHYCLMIFHEMHALHYVFFVIEFVLHIESALA